MNKDIEQAFSIIRTIQAERKRYQEMCKKLKDYNKNLKNENNRLKEDIKILKDRPSGFEDLFSNFNGKK